MSAPVDIIVRTARLRGQNGPVDIAITKDRIGSVQAAIAAKARREIDAAGSLVLPGLFNLHLHSDKSLLGEVMRPNVSGTLPEAIEITNEFKRNYDPAEVAGRAVRVLEAGVKNGTTFFRLFSDVGTIGGLRAACFSHVRNSAVTAISRSWHSHRKASCEIPAPPNCWTRR